MFGVGLWEGLIILTLVLLVFGGRKLPELGSALGKSLVNFKKGLREANQDEEKIEDKKSDQE